MKPINVKSPFRSRPDSQKVNSPVTNHGKSTKVFDPQSMKPKKKLRLAKGGMAKKGC